jgi:hypothetical protein
MGVCVPVKLLHSSIWPENERACPNRSDVKIEGDERLPEHLAKVANQNGSGNRSGGIQLSRAAFDAMSSRV